MLEETRPDGHDRGRGLVSSRVSGSRIESRMFAPGPELADVVQYFWITRWDLRDQPPHVAELLADPCVNIVFEAGRSRVVGVSTHLWRRQLDGVGSIRAAKLRAGAARAVMAGPTSSLTDRIVGLRTRFADADAELERRVLEPEDDREALAHLHAWLVAHRVRPVDPNVARVAQMVEHIAREQVTSATAMAATFGVGLRPLQRLFRAYVGATPKWVIRRFRLQEAALRLERGEVSSLAHLAADLGYSDHAHLSRDFKAATGRSPKAFTKSVWE